MSLTTILWLSLVTGAQGHSLFLFFSDPSSGPRGLLTSALRWLVSACPVCGPQAFLLETWLRPLRRCCPLVSARCTSRAAPGTCGLCQQWTWHPPRTPRPASNGLGAHPHVRPAWARDMHELRVSQQPGQVLWPFRETVKRRLHGAVLRALRRRVCERACVQRSGFCWDIPWPVLHTPWASPRRACTWLPQGPSCRLPSEVRRLQAGGTAALLDQLRTTAPQNSQARSPAVWPLLRDAPRVPPAGPGDWGGLRRGPSPCPTRCICQGRKQEDVWSVSVLKCGVSLAGFPASTELSHARGRRPPRLLEEQEGDDSGKALSREPTARRSPPRGAHPIWTHLRREPRRVGCRRAAQGVGAMLRGPLGSHLQH